MKAILRKMPILLILVAGIFVLSVSVNYRHQQDRLKVAADQRQVERSKNIGFYLTLSKQFGAKEQWDDLQSLLEAARVDKQIDFYVLQYQGHAVWFGEKNDDVSRLDVDYPHANGQLQIGPEVALGTVDIGADYRVTVGVEDRRTALTSASQGSLIEMLTEESIYTLAIVLVVAMWALKDLLSVVREIRRGRKAQVSQLKTQSAEAEVFRKGLAGYSRALDDLESENRRLGRQVLPSLRKEIFSGKKPPYDFQCTMVRTDINHFSTIYNTHNVTDFMSTINDFFDEVSRIVARYGGLVHEFVGDEVIYYFKDDEHQSSFAVALSAVRDINRAAENFDRETKKIRGYPFTVKSSLAHGKVRFGPLVNGFTVAGSVLIETVRILSHINEKDENVIYFDGAQLRLLNDSVDGLIRSEARSRVTLKGYQHEIELHQYVDHRSLRAILETLDLETLPLLSCYRSNDDLTETLKDLQTKVRMRPVAVTLKALYELRRPYVTGTEIFGDQLCAWIKELVHDFESGSFEGADRVLSAVPMLFLNLVPKDGFRSTYKEALQSLLACTDRRVVANAVEVLTHFTTEIKLSELHKVRALDLRVAANAIVYEGSQELSAGVLKKLSSLIRSKKPAEIGSGLYAIGELALVHRTRDMTYYLSHVEFGELIQQLDRYAQHISTSVRRQAMTAARKADDPAVLERIRLFVQDSGSELLREELSRYIGTVNENPSSTHNRKAS